MYPGRAGEPPAHAGRNQASVRPGLVRGRRRRGRFQRDRDRETCGGRFNLALTIGAQRGLGNTELPTQQGVLGEGLKDIFLPGQQERGESGKRGCDDGGGLRIRWTLGIPGKFSLVWSGCLKRDDSEISLFSEGLRIAEYGAISTFWSQIRSGDPLQIVQRHGQYLLPIGAALLRGTAKQ